MRKCGYIGLALLFLTTLTVAAPPAAIPKVSLVYKFAKDDVIHYAADINMTMDLPGAGKQIVSAHSDMSMKVLAITGELTTLEMQIERMKMTSGTLTFDTNVKEDRERIEQNPAMKPILLMIGTPIKLSMKPTGEVTTYDLAELKKKLDGAAMPQMLGTMKEQLDQMSNGSLILLPDHPVGKGDTWNGKVHATAIGVGKIEVAYTFKFDAVEQINGDKCARLSLTGAATLKVDDAAREKPTLTKYTETGTVIFSIDRGRLVSSQVDGNMRLGLPGDKEVGIEMSVKVHEGEK